MTRQICALFLFLSFALSAHSQESEDSEGWPGIPGFNLEGAVLIDQESFLSVMGVATVSYLVAEFLTDASPMDFYQVRGGVFGGHDNTTILMENFGVERRVAPWFGMALEINNQQWTQPGYSGVGMGFNYYFRWHAFGKRKLSPYLEYGAGTFWGFKKFPRDGTNFTFNLTTQLGAEYTFETNNKLRLSYGHIHQSNNGLLDVNPGIDGNGLNVTYLWFWK